MTPRHPHSYQRAAGIGGVILLTASVSGFFMGLRQTGSQISLTRPVSLVSHDPARRFAQQTNTVPLAVSYSKQNWLRDGPNAGWQNGVGQLLQPPPPPPPTHVDEADRAVALEFRATRRAFDGAPPVVPHAITQESSTACLACHGEGLVVKDRVASRVSHPRYASCTQCHVPSFGPGIPIGQTGLQRPIVDNLFAGADAALRGSRAWAQAPPTVPHPTLMRSDCLSCHGPRGLAGLRTPHPDRQNCLQCHVPDARIEQHDFSPPPGLQLSSHLPRPLRPSRSTTGAESTQWAGEGKTRRFVSGGRVRRAQGIPQVPDSGTSRVAAHSP